jgi:hypothetical protein
MERALIPIFAFLSAPQEPPQFLSVEEAATPLSAEQKKKRDATRRRLRKL